MLFLEKDKPIATCVAESCNDCDVQDSLHCHFGAKDLFHFLSISLPSLLLGGAGIYHMNAWMLIPWLIIIIGYFGFIEIRVMCSHCPHYAEPTDKLKCWANYGAPKLWKYNPGPMSFGEKVLFLGGFILVWGYPVPFILAESQWFILLVYLLCIIGFFMTLKMFLCTQCMNFACPLNSVEEELRKKFFKKNPEVAKAWDVDVTSDNQQQKANNQ